MIGDRREAAFAEPGFDCRRAPRLDDEAEAVDGRRPLLRRPLEDDGAPVADIHDHLPAIVASELPSHQRGVERRLLAIVRHPARRCVRAPLFSSPWTGMTVRSGPSPLQHRVDMPACHIRRGNGPGQTRPPQTASPLRQRPGPSAGFAARSSGAHCSTASSPCCDSVNVSGRRQEPAPERSAFRCSSGSS